MDDVRAALLGDHEAAKRLTDAANFREQIENEALNRNTRAPILNSEEMEMIKNGQFTGQPDCWGEHEL